VSIFRSAAIVLLPLLLFGQQTSAQSLTFDIFARYLDALREQAGIPGLAAAVVQSGQSKPVWDRGFGLARVTEGVRVDPDTPFPVLDLTQIFGGVLVLQQCIERGEAVLEDSVRRWSPTFTDQFTTFRQVLSHQPPAGYQYSSDRFRYLTDAVAECADREYERVFVDEILGRLPMIDSVPGGDVIATGSRIRQIYPTARYNEWISDLNRMAFPYRVDGNRRPSRSEYQVPPITTNNGLISTVRDLAAFDAALESYVLVRKPTLDLARTRVGSGPTGLGWFVQTLPNGKQVIWHFGRAENAYSSLMIKVPGSGLTLFLLANSDGLSAPYQFERGDITTSPFARLFFTLLG
jgi:CubicO group peptidase (beta-lactamase class C family)